MRPASSNQEARRADAVERESRDTTERLEARLVEAEERAAEAVVRVAELEQELDVVRAELDVVTLAWHAAEAGARKHAERSSAHVSHRDHAA